MASTRRRSSSHGQNSASPSAASVAYHSDGARIGRLDDFQDDDISASSDTTEPEAFGTALIPLWQHELAASRAGRTSRASSVFSTRTRLTHQSDDARSIEIEAGGQSFRISRDGSYVTNTTAPPPYPGSPLSEVAEESDDETGSSITPRQSRDLERDAGFDDNLPIKTHPSTDTPPRDTSPNAVRRQLAFELPQRLRSVLNLRWYGSTTECHEMRNEQLRRAGSLRRTQSESSSLANVTTLSTCDGEEQTVSNEDDPTGLPLLDAERQTQHLKLRQALDLLQATDEQTAEISRHYNGLMRDVDRDYRRNLHERDKELARFRELLNEKDIVSRQQMRDRDYTIEALKNQIHAKDHDINNLKTQNYKMEEDFEEKLERARNEVEDAWEKRWKEYERLLIDRLGERSMSVRQDQLKEPMGNRTTEE